LAGGLATQEAPVEDSAAELRLFQALLHDRNRGAGLTVHAIRVEHPPIRVTASVTDIATLLTRAVGDDRRRSFHDDSERSRSITWYRC
jgi:hypothetical protein